MSLVSQLTKDNFTNALMAFVARLEEQVDLAASAKQSAETFSQVSAQKATDATVAADTAITKAADAVAAALKSYLWANGAEDAAVENGEFSAYHHRRKAEIAAQQVLTALAGAVTFKGQWDASADSFPVANSGWMYRINAGGTLTFEDAGTKLVSIGDYILKTDTGWTHIDEATDAVKTSRTINGKPLNVDIILSPADVQAVALADLATQAEAVAGTAADKWMSPLAVRQAVASFGHGTTGALPLLANMDDLTIPTGVYRVDATTTGTWPANVPAGNGVVFINRITTTNTGRYYLLIMTTGVYCRTGIVSWRNIDGSRFGIGGAATTMSSTDLNSQLSGGLFITQSAGMTGLPPGWSQDHHTVIVSGSASQLIIAADASPDVGKMALRSYNRNTSTWGSWFEVWTSQRLKLQTSATDNTAGSVLLTGAGGMVVGNALDAGGGAINANDLINGTIHRYETTETAATAFNLPALGGAGTTARHWLVFTYGIANRRVQEATEVFGLNTTKGRKFVRVFQDSTWSNWKYLWDTDNLVKQSTLTDNTAGRMLVVGAGGLLGHAQTWGTQNNANLINVNGFFRVGDSMLNVPSGVLGGSVLVNYQYDADDQYQEIFDRDSDVRYYRRCKAGNWSNWTKMFHSTSPISDHPELNAKLESLSLQSMLAI